MDENVLAAMARWPDVPDVYGWLSLSESGTWRLHPQGDALDGSAGAGEAITSPQITAFIDRNYASDDQGRWYFQNGPQRVFVRLDAAPFLLRTEFSGSTGPLRLRTHNKLCVQCVAQWWLDDSGRLYAVTEHGPALVAGRDLAEVVDRLLTADGRALAEVLGGSAGTPQGVLQVQGGPAPTQPIDTAPVPAEGRADIAARTAPLRFCAADDVPDLLGFRRHPRPAS